ncbi:MAG: homoserine kinase [Thaumarchaeota archaeon]|nr:homoserine kinase [Nitrososphaerota archaeon]
MASMVTVEAPASSANLGAGFDVFALALARPKDRLTLEKAQSGIKLSVHGEQLPTTPHSNVVEAVAKAIMAGERVREGVRLRLRKRVPIGAGLGSSAASSSATVVGMNALFDLRLTNKKQIDYAGIGERFASGTAHYDNVTAALFGGFVLVSKDKSFSRMEPPHSLVLCLVIPRVKLPLQKTRYARSLLPRRLSIEEAVAAVSAASMMVHGLAVDSVEEFGAAMSGGFVDTRRSVMIPGFERVKKAAVEHGAAGVCISGAGPAMLAATKGNKGRVILEAMTDAFEKESVKSDGFITKVGEGCRVIEQKGSVTLAGQVGRFPF